MSKLYELTERYENLQNLLDDENIEPEQLKEALDQVEDEINVKADNVAKFIKSLEADAEAIKVEEKRLADRRRALLNKSTSLKDYLFGELEGAGLKRIKSALFSINIQNNPPSVAILDETKIPFDYIKVEEVKKVDKRGILEQLKAGVKVPGVEMQKGQSLRIR